MSFHKVSKFTLKLFFWRILAKKLFLEPEIQEVEGNQYLRILISHMPLLSMPGQFTKKAIDRFKPHVIFSGHQHRSIRIRSEPGTIRYSSSFSLQENGNFVSEFDLFDLREKKELLEITVPTANYRMGSNYIGKLFFSPH